MPQTRNKSEYFIPRLLAVLLFSAFFVLFDRPYASVTMLLLFLLMAVSMMVLQNGKLTLRITFFHIWMLAFGLFCFLSVIWAWDTENAMTRGKTAFSMLVCYSLAYLCYQEFDSVDSLLKAVLWGGNAVMLVIFGTFGVHGILSLLEYGDRLSEQFYLNSNVVGVVCAMSMVTNVYYILKDKRIRWWNLFLVPGVIILSATGSRQALAIMAGGLVLLMFLTMIRGRSPGEIAIFFVAGILLLIGMLILIARLPAFSGIYRRMLSMVSAVTGVGKTDRSATTRLALIDVGLAQFKRTPILGVGMGSGHLVAWKYLNKSFYLHNNFAEVLAGGGLVGFTIYYSIYAYIFVRFFRYRRYATLETAVCVTLLIMALVEDYASVTYYAKETYFYLMLGFLETEKLKRDCQSSLPHMLTLQDNGAERI